MDESFIMTVRLSKETGYKYNITLRIVYNDKQSIFYIYIENSLEQLNSFKTNFFIIETSGNIMIFYTCIGCQEERGTPIVLCVGWES